jgi:hypothetical protein
MGVTGQWLEANSREIDSLTGLFSIQYARRVIDSFTKHRGPIGGSFALAHIDTTALPAPCSRMVGACQMLSLRHWRHS